MEEVAAANSSHACVDLRETQCSASATVAASGVPTLVAHAEPVEKVTYVYPTEEAGDAAARTVNAEPRTAQIFVATIVLWKKQRLLRGPNAAVCWTNSGRGGGWGCCERKRKSQSLSLTSTVEKIGCRWSQGRMTRLVLGGSES
jgi:hypothetical protein